MGDQVRWAVAIPPGSTTRGLDVIAVAAHCPGVIGGVSVDEQWTRVAGLTSAPAQSDCGEPVWVEVAPERSDRSPDGLLIVVDTLRVDHVTPEGAPEMWAHAQAAWWPEQTWAPSPWTQPSVAALFTGRPPWAIAPESLLELPQEQVTLAEVLPGHEAWFVTTNPYTYASRGFGQGFERVAEFRDDSTALETLLGWLEEPRRGPRLVVAHLIGPHLPYEPRPPPAGGTERVGDQFWDLDNAETYTDPLDQARIRELYRAEVAQVDVHVGRLLEAMPGAIIAIVSDHGEELFEHGGFEHGHALWPEVTRVHAAISGDAERPGGLTRLQDVGVALAKRLGALDPGTWASPSDAVFLARMLPTRPKRVRIHRQGVVAPEGLLFTGPQPHVEGDEKALRRRLADFRKMRWTEERVNRRVCRLTVTPGVPLSISAETRWDVPPGAWGPARREGDRILVEPVRGGTWAVMGVDGEDCDLEISLEPIPFTELELERLRALGYAD